MKRGLIGALGVAGAVALLTIAATTFEGAFAQERAAEAPAVQRLVTVLGGSGGYLGVTIDDVDEERAESLRLPGEYGVYVETVVEGGPAEEAGLEAGDVILRWRGEHLESVAQLQRLVRETPPGRTIDLGIFRDGRERQVSITLGDRADAPGGLRVMTAPEGRLMTPRGNLVPRMRERLRSGAAPRVEVRSLFAGRGRLGVSVMSLSEQLAEYFGTDGGALVTSVSEDSPAEAAGMRAGDVIVGVAGEDVEDPGDLLEVLGERDAGPVSVRVIRDRQERSFTVELEERGEWREREGEGYGFHMWTDDEGEHVFSVEPFTWPGLELGPMQFEGFELEPFNWHFELDEGEGGAIRIDLPRIEIPGFELPALELPAIEVPGFEVRAQEVEVST